MTLNRFIIRLPSFIFTVIVVAAVLYLTLMPDPLPDNNIELFPGADKVVHGIMMFGVISCLAFDYLRKHPATHDAPGVILTIFLIITIAFGGAIELLQGWMDMGRGEDLFDFLADSVGALAGYIMARLLWKPASRWLTGQQ